MNTKAYIEYVQKLASDTKVDNLNPLLINSKEWDGCNEPGVLNLIASTVMIDLSQKEFSGYALSNILAILTYPSNWKHLNGEHRSAIQKYGAMSHLRPFEDITHPKAKHRNRGDWYNGLQSWACVLSPSIGGGITLDAYNAYALPMELYEDRYWYFFLDPEHGQVLSTEPNVVEGNRLIKEFEEKRRTATVEELWEIHEKICMEIYPNKKK